MFWLLTALLTLLAALLEARIQVDLQHFDITRARIRLDIAHLHKTWRLMLVRTERGHRAILADELGTRPLDSGDLRQSQSRHLLDALIRADKARRFLLHHTHLERLDALALLCTQDAARSALLCGMVQGALACIPAARRRCVHIRVLPEFFRTHSTVNARCIIRFRLGTIFLTATMLLAAYLRQQRLTESEAA